MLSGHQSLKAPLICLALGPVADRSGTIVAASRASRPHQNEGIAAEEECAKYSLIHPQAAAPRKNFSTLEGCPFISTLYLLIQDSYYPVPDLQIFLSFLDLPGRISRKLSSAECIDRLFNLWTLPSSTLIPLWQIQEEKALQSSSPLSSEICKGWSRVEGDRSDPDLHEDSLVFQIQVNPSGKTSMQWARTTDLVQDLLLNLEGRLGIPSSCLRLVFKGKQLTTTLPLSFYNI